MLINLLLCGNEKVFDGALTELISITNRTKEDINCYTIDCSNDWKSKQKKKMNNDCVESCNISKIYEINRIKKDNFKILHELIDNNKGNEDKKKNLEKNS